MLLDSRRQRPRILLNIIQYVRQPLTTKNYLASNVSRAKVIKFQMGGKANALNVNIRKRKKAEYQRSNYPSEKASKRIAHYSQRKWDKQS